MVLVVLGTVSISAVEMVSFARKVDLLNGNPLMIRQIDSLLAV